jgi:hypothetical protein
MKKILTSLLLAIIAVTAFAQKTINDPNAEKRSVSGFHAIEVGGGIDLYLSQGSEAVAVSASETKFRDKIKTEVVNGVLKIHYEYEKGIKITVNGQKKNLKAYVSFSQLDGLHAGGGSDVKVDGTIKVPKLDLNISGGSDFAGRVDLTTLNAKASGGSDINISGNATTLDVNASGGSDFDGFELTVENCSAEASGGSDINITATKELNVESSGGSDVHYKGSAVIKNIKNSGGGSVKKGSK